MSSTNTFSKSSRELDQLLQEMEVETAHMLQTLSRTVVLAEGKGDIEGARQKGMACTQVSNLRESLTTANLSQLDQTKESDDMAMEKSPEPEQTTKTSHGNETLSVFRSRMQNSQKTSSDMETEEVGSTPSLCRGG